MASEARVCMNGNDTSGSDQAVCSLIYHSCMVQDEPETVLLRDEESRMNLFSLNTGSYHHEPRE